MASVLVTLPHVKCIATVLPVAHLLALGCRKPRGMRSPSEILAPRSMRERMGFSAMTGETAVMPLRRPGD